MENIKTWLYFNINILIISILVFMLSVLPACGDMLPNLLNNSQQDNSGVSAESVAKSILEDFVSENSTKLIEFIHPNKGVRFSSSAYVDIKSDMVFSKEQIQQLWQDTKTYTWGNSEGTGDPIVLTPKQYCRNYMLKRDFLKQASVHINNNQAKGNTTNNVADTYPGTTTVEYYIQPSTKGGSAQMDWAALRLIFEKLDGNWYLVAVINDQWSP